MKKIDLNTLLNLVEEKYKIDSNNSNWYKGYKSYFEGLKNEIIEVENELKENNSIYLEDELGDIFWNYLNFLKGLEAQGYITSIENIFGRCEKKFIQRLDGIKQNGLENRSLSWKEVKIKQKEELKKEHNLKYNNK